MIVEKSGTHKETLMVHRKTGKIFSQTFDVADPVALVVEDNKLAETVEDEIRVSSKDWPRNAVNDELKKAEAKERGYYVAPAYTHIWLNPNPKAELQVTYLAESGKKGYIYTAAHWNRVNAEKFNRTKKLTKKLPSILKAIDNDFYAKPEAQVLDLIYKTGFRVGSNKEIIAKVKAYGASTLTSDMVKVNGDHMHFSFIAKKGVQVEHDLKDKKLAELLSNKKGRLFKTEYPEVAKYFKKLVKGFKIKDFRTLRGTAIALKEVEAFKPQPTDAAQIKKAMNAVCKTVASELGNTPAVAKKAYISPEVWRVWIT
jgi:DNA topoisomerase-1